MDNLYLNLILQKLDLHQKFNNVDDALKAIYLKMEALEWIDIKNKHPNLCDEFIMVTIQCIEDSSNVSVLAFSSMDMHNKNYIEFKNRVFKETNGYFDSKKEYRVLAWKRNHEPFQEF